MKLYLADEEKLNTFDLPQKVGESFLFSYTPNFTNIEVFFNIYSNNDKWYIKNNSDIIINNSNSDILLENYKFYEVKIKGIINPFYLYTYDSYNNNYQDINIESLNTFTIGSNPSDNISYSNALTIQKHLTITKNEGISTLEINPENKINIYINNRIIKTKYIIGNGDIIFINNLKIIWMNSYIRIFLPTDAVTFSSNMTINNKEIINNDNYLSYTVGENDESLYKEDDFFFRKPRLSVSYEEEELTIDPPTNKESKEDVPAIFSLGTGMTMVVTSIVTAYRSIINYNSGKATKTDFTIALITASVMLICSFLLPKIMQTYNKRKQKKRDQLREKKYTEYLSEKQGEIDKIIKFESQSLYDKYPSGKECFDIVVGVKNRLWEREVSDLDFLSVRVGLGNIPSSLKVSAPQKKFSLDEDELLDKVYSMNENSKNLLNVPITISLVNNLVTSIINNDANSEKFLNGILLQILCLHNPKDLKIVFLTNKKNENKWEYLKLTPHIYSDDKSVRFFATNEDEAKKVLKEIDELYNNRKEEIKNSSEDVDEEKEKKDYYKDFNPYYLIITDNYRKYKNLDFINKINFSAKNIGFSLLILDNSLKNLPNQCTKYAYVTDKNSCIFEKNYSKNNQLNFSTECFDNLDMYRVARELSNVPVQTMSDIYSLPNMLSFLEMNNVGNIEQLNILNKWSSSNPISTLQCPVGVSPSGELFKLDLHEKAHGPHGLIAGSTGSGKSEFIITYILSMAINYHPDEVQFVLIDYKGGGLAGAFENRETGIRIPHLSGTITNLDVSEMNRTLVSINSEMKRRQAKFNEVRDKLGESTIDIYKYQKFYREGLIDEPIPHLFIISDEFAELKSQQPDFMDELISTARIGRSLGVHLILATQKPAGVVNDQIWSNSKFKVCLKVQSKADSMEMLKRPEAASIKETGRFYLQVGYDELFELGQSAWAGAQYNPTEKLIKKIDDSISFVDSTGDVIKSANDLNNKDTTTKNNKGDQLTNVVKYLNDIAIKNNIKPKQLWLDSIDKEIYLSNLIKKYNFTVKPYIMEAIIGEYDDPAEQKQGLLSIDITNKGNTLIYGIPGSGKENLLTTIITSLCSRHTSDELNIYIMDFGAETLMKFKDFPQVGDVVFINELEKLNSLYTFLAKEINRRKSLFANYMGSYVDFIKKSEKKLPNIICIIHQYETISESMITFTEKLTNLFKEGPKFGINFIITNTLATGIRSKVLQLFPNKMVLKLSDPNDYRYIIEAPRGLIPANYFGRGLVKLNKTLEFQTAYISKPDDINNTITELCNGLKNQKLKKAPRIPSMPDFLTVDKLINSGYTLENVPVGISKTKLTLITNNFNENFTPIISSDPRANMHFIYGLVELLKQIPDTKVRVVDVLKLYNNSQGIKVFNEDFNTIIKQIRLETLKDEKLDHKNIFIIIGLGAFKNNVSAKTQLSFNNVFSTLKIYKNNKFIIYDEYNSYKSLEVEAWFNPNVDKTSGIWLGENGANQLAIRMPNFTLEERKIDFNQIGYVVKNSSHTIIRYIVDKEFDNEK